MSSPAVSGGAVLSAADIDRLSDPRKISPGAKPLIEDLAPENLKGAAYDLRVAENGIAFSSGIVVRPTDSPWRRPILLAPGETIFVTTRERLNIPTDLVGNTSIKGELAGQGVLLLTGLIVDPGYHLGGSGDGRLHFRLANLGRRPVLLDPGKTKIASIQFLRLTEPSEREPGHSFDDVWKRIDEVQEGLGFLEDVRALDERVTVLDTEIQRQGRVVNIAVGAVLLVVLTTLLGAFATALLTLGTQPGLIDAVKRVIPRSTSDRILEVVALFGLASIAFAITAGMQFRGRSDVPDPQTPGYARREALRDLRAERRRRVAIAGACLAIIAIVATALTTRYDLKWWGVALVALGLVAVACWRLWTRVWWSIPRWRVDERIRGWEKEALERGRKDQT